MLCFCVIYKCADNKQMHVYVLLLKDPCSWLKGITSKLSLRYLYELTISSTVRPTLNRYSVLLCRLGRTCIHFDLDVLIKTHHFLHQSVRVLSIVCRSFPDDAVKTMSSAYNNNSNTIDNFSSIRRGIWAWYIIVYFDSVPFIFHLVKGFNISWYCTHWYCTQIFFT